MSFKEDATTAPTYPRSTLEVSSWALLGHLQENTLGPASAVGSLAQVVGAGCWCQAPKSLLLEHPQPPEAEGPVVLGAAGPGTLRFVLQHCLEIHGDLVVEAVLVLCQAVTRITVSSGQIQNDKRLGHAPAAAPASERAEMALDSRLPGDSRVPDSLPQEQAILQD